jgi:predicted hydrocarbon binding protein
MTGVKEISEALDKLLGNVTFDPEKGEFRAQDSRLMILFATSFVSVQKSIETLIGFDTAGMLLYEAYKDAARISGPLYIKGAKPGIKGGHTIKLGLDFTRALAWGLWEPCEFDKTKATFIVRNSPVAESYGKSNRAVCHQIRGMIAGFAEFFTGQKRECVEVMCKSKGDDRCEFLVAAPEDITRLTLERLEKDGRKS